MNTLRLGVAQIPNSLEISRNAQTILEALEQFQQAHVDLALFPECALSGYSSQIGDCTLDRLRPLLEEIRLWSARTRLAVALPSALRESGQIYNSGFWFQDGNVSRFHKHGLTESERQFFAQPESSGSRTFTVRKFNLGILLCREAEDAAWTHFEEESVDAVLWPAYWGWTQADDWGPTQLNGSPNLIHANMALWKAPLIQSCFASNVPADSAKRAPQGLSIVVDADNRCVGRAPWARSSLTTITLSRADESTRVLRVEELAPRS